MTETQVTEAAELCEKLWTFANFGQRDGRFDERLCRELLRQAAEMIEALSSRAPQAGGEGLNSGEAWGSAGHRAAQGYNSADPLPGISTEPVTRTGGPPVLVAQGIERPTPIRQADGSNPSEHATLSGTTSETARVLIDQLEREGCVYGNTDQTGSIGDQAIPLIVAALTKAASPAPQAGGEGLRHDDLCRLSRLFNQTANLDVRSRDFYINEWLKRRIAEAAGDPPPKYTDWRPMDTAPKDGTRVMLRGSGYFGFEKCEYIGFWDGARWTNEQGFEWKPNAWREVLASPTPADEPKGDDVFSENERLRAELANSAHEIGRLNVMLRAPKGDVHRALERARTFITNRYLLGADEDRTEAGQAVALIDAALSTPPPAQDEGEADTWIEREFSGHGRAIRRQDETPLPGEPYMSMADAKELTRRAVAMFSSQDEGELRQVLADCKKACDEIDSLRASEGELRRALEPFAEKVKDKQPSDHSGKFTLVPVAWLYAAREALKGKP